MANQPSSPAAPKLPTEKQILTAVKNGIAQLRKGAADDFADSPNKILGPSTVEKRGADLNPQQIKLLEGALNSQFIKDFGGKPMKGTLKATTTFKGTAQAVGRRFDPVVLIAWA